MSTRPQRLAQRISSGESAEPILPLTHITDAYTFRDIVDNAEIQPNKCKVFNGETLIYTFYGRPAYKIPDADELPPEPVYLPVCLILRPPSGVSIKRVHALDTGALQHFRTIPGIHRKMMKEDFSLEPSLESAAKLVRLVYGDNKRYLNNEPVETLACGAFELELNALMTMARDTTSSNSPDERITTVEVQYTEPIPLKENCLAIILPGVFAEDAEVKRLTSGIELLRYDIVRRMAPSQYSSQIYDLAKSYLKRAKLLPDG